MSETTSNKKYENTYVFYGRKVVRHGDHYAIYIPRELALHILTVYNGYVDIEIKVPTQYPKKKA